ncbi:paraquat-inducible protein A [Colwellia hornerae]|uniref:Paraquat-inducible protein A n=1 Tax=Colwellia hornerae TaxID=89402 RepID=A0A5C6QC26_9GAMM|nr:paraquat-inducible protein A [Colwellia hornerae]TWX53013.1 paraquat-inducible protein A [Colwellia hornerae]TWX59276.1 paraquat-inducible protein A [Colwellia hornerae]TWX66162.1 paraquat-inducible protein A [Colwellia hornerae]
MKTHLGFYLNLIAILLFIPGILLPMFSLSMDVSATIAGPALTSALINKELSLLTTIQELWQNDRLLVSGLIFIFSICIPLLKTALVAWSYFKRKTQLERKIISFVGAIGKWSMADVFVVAIFLAVLSTNHAETASQQTLSIMGFKLNLMISSETLSAVGPGFYFFCAYCLLSLIGTQLSQSGLYKVSRLNE